MTDNEIIKALECCSNAYDCPDCPFEDDCGSMCNLATATIDLINRQKAEIERLAEIANPKCQKCVSRTIESAKTEAVKEFAERLKEKMRNCAMYCTDEHTYYLIGYSLIDNLVKEMVGRND